MTGGERLSISFQFVNGAAESNFAAHLPQTGERLRRGDQL